MRTVDFDTLNLHWLQPSRTHNLDSTCSPNKALQLTIFPLLRNGKTAAELCVKQRVVGQKKGKPMAAKVDLYNSSYGNYGARVR